MKYLLILFALVSLLAACQQNSTNNSASYNDLQETTTPKNGGVKLITIDGKYRVWTKRIGNNPKIKVLLLHGGPACTHEYFECMESFLPAEGIEFYYYDQLGSYYSDQPKDTSLWHTARFVEEVEQVRKGLGLDSSNFFVLGHSWGGILALEYALKYQHNMKGLIISNMMSSIPEYEKYNGTLRAKLRRSLLDSLESYEKRGATSDPTYNKLVVDNYYTEHIIRMPPTEWPDAVNRGMVRHINYEIYSLMQGPSEFKVGGRLLTWDRTADLPKVTVPTLTVGGAHDTMDPAYMEMMSKKVQKGSYLFCPNGSHMSMWDDQKNYMEGIIKFMKSVK